MIKLRSENLSNLGGPMGSEYTFDNWVKYFNSLSKAMKYAEKDFGRPLEWFEEDFGYRTADLNYVMYYIEYVLTED